MNNQSNDLYAKITNDFLLSLLKGQCNIFSDHNNFGNYFQQCSKENQSTLGIK